jgi:hypothetical protein
LFLLLHFGKEAGLPVVAALDDVQGNIGQRQASAARHGPLLMGQQRILFKRKTVVCPLLFYFSHGGY